LKKLSSKVEKDHSRSKLGMKLMLLLFQITGTGETSMEPTSCHGTRTNISLSIADHAGLKEQLLLLPTDSTFFLETRTQHPLVLMLRLLSTARLVEAVKVETQVVSMNLQPRTVSQTHHANNMLPMTSREAAKQSTCAKTAPGHHAQLGKHAKTNAGLSTTRSTILPTTTAFLEPAK